MVILGQIERGRKKEWAIEEKREADWERDGGDQSWVGQSRGGGNEIERKKRWDWSWVVATRSWVDDLTQIVVAGTTAGLWVEDDNLGFTDC